ncbi:MAG: trigger factor [Paludibacteraceae bacterium]|nr:trigger factor [Paludibacteraceae bacterium]
MNVLQNNSDAVNATLTVTVTPADYTEKVEKAIKDYRKKAVMPGFRPGTVPASLIKRKFGEAFLAEEVNKLISEALYKHITDNKLDILGEPLPTIDFPTPDLKEGEEFNFSFDIAIAPAIEVSLSKKNKVTYYTIDVDKKMIDQQTASYRGRFGKYVKAEETGEKDVIKGKLVELDDKGSVKDDGVNVEGAMISPNYMKKDEEKKKCYGKKIGESFDFNPFNAFGGSEVELASLLKLDKEKAKEFKSDCRFTVEEITRFAEAEMNQEFFDECFGKGTVKSAEEFEAKIKSELANQFVADSDIKFILDMRALVLDGLKDVKFPEEFLKRWLKEQNKEMTDEKIDSEFSKMLDDLKWQLFKDKTAKEADVKIEEADIKEVAKRQAKAQFAQYGMLSIPDEYLENYVKEMLQNKDGRKNVVERALEDKVIAILKDKVTITEKGVSFEEFNKFFK